VDREQVLGRVENLLEALGALFGLTAANPLDR
jgi:hypothetical protein